MDWSSAGPLWQRQSAGESRWARTEAVGEGRATSPTSLQPRVTQMYQLLVQLARTGTPVGRCVLLEPPSIRIREFLLDPLLIEKPRGDTLGSGRSLEARTR